MTLFFLIFGVFCVFSSVIFAVIHYTVAKIQDDKEKNNLDNF